MMPLYTGASYTSSPHPVDGMYRSDQSHEQIVEARKEFQNLDENWSHLKIRFALAGYPICSGQDEQDRMEGLPITGWNLALPAIFYDLHLVNPRKPRKARNYGGHRG